MNWLRLRRVSVKFDGLSQLCDTGLAIASFKLSLTQVEIGLWAFWPKFDGFRKFALRGNILLFLKLNNAHIEMTGIVGGVADKFRFEFSARIEQRSIAFVPQNHHSEIGVSARRGRVQLECFAKFRGR